ncbi:MAG: hypothetical protein CSB49_06460 [Proteobacteria bacterium]|nr:MAG: hypothetical protein CSB49_06460 [Pseudomonadota bacterium]
MRTFRSYLLPTLAGALLLVAGVSCSEDDSASADLGVADLSPGEPISPPDFSALDTTVGPVGNSCDPAGPNTCGGQAICFDVGRGIGVCAIPDCTLEDPETSPNEDTCPKGTACGEVSWSADGGYGRRTFCFVKCTAASDRNPCQQRHPQLACDPSTILLTGYTEVCAAPGCSQDGECGAFSPRDPKATCDTKTNLCFVNGKPGASIGAPCASSLDCGEEQFCYVEGGAVKDKVVGGYCTKVGCKYKGRWSCPAGSSCFQLGATQAVSICLATGCDTKAAEEKDGCRDEATAGVYDCFKIGKESVCWVKQK